ncbi:hypothetical protein [Nocardia wallacei]|uniref:Uncharacterized protein n=1 Tax=Nocardia wallacei TaxID=480035 RepID=A0A7G1KW07_9NOCA|nr:hypothetical protein [Nocardia wallacei]BCK59418.1 hypothetical protein NWFMUON74_71900 [Nocardia wallacei]
MIAPRDPGKQLPLLINPNDPPREIDVQEMRAVLETLLEGLRQWDGTTPAADAGDGEQQDIRALMDESMAAFAEMGIQVQFQAPR